MPTPRQSAPTLAGAPRIGAFASRMEPVSDGTPCPEVARLFGRHPAWTSIIVRHPRHGLCVLDRQSFEARMSGPHGFGRSLDHRTPVGVLVGSRGTLRMAADVSVLTAYQALVARPPRYRHHDLLIEDLPSGGAGLAGAGLVLEAIASLHADLALYDDLTGLRNRKGLLQCIDRLLDGGTRGLAVLFLDLDRFKVINDSLGHEVGDDLLRAVASRFQESLPDGAEIMRIGGDEFAIVGRAEGRDGAIRIAEQVLQSLRTPFTLKERELTVTSSVGIGISEVGDDALSLLRKADLAMYEAKRRGPSMYAVFSGALESAADRRLDLEMELRRAIARNEIAVASQPIVRLADRELVGFEALVRWRGSARSPVRNPESFLPVAEETGLIHLIDRTVLVQAAAALRKWRPYRPNLMMSVNLDPAVLNGEHFVEEVAAFCRRAGIEPSWLQFEVTESRLMQDLERGIAAMTELRALGIRLAIDDFGTGYSSLNQIKQLPMDTLKIDKSFISSLDTEAPDREIVRLILALGSAMGVSIVAEGIEEEEHVRVLLEMGCDMGQGYLFSRPVDARRAGALVTADRLDWAA